MTELTSKPRASLASRLGSLTPARVALGRTGSSLTTQEVLRFQLAHAEARDAVHVPLDSGALSAGVADLGCEVLRVQTLATRRDIYLRRPDLGRRLEAKSAERLDALRSDDCDIAIVVADGLSSRALVSNAVPLLSRLIPKLADAGLTRAPVVVAEGARVALGDEIAQRLGARLALLSVSGPASPRPTVSAPISPTPPGRDARTRNGTVCRTSAPAGSMSKRRPPGSRGWS